MENLPHEVLSDIFIRLLAKQIAQMRCVCKSWNALLSESSFIKSHLHRSINKQDEILLFFRYGFSLDSKPLTLRPSRSPDLEPTNFIKVPVNPKFQNGHGSVIGSMNGLICFSLKSSQNDFVVYIWNPSLSAVLTLPPSILPVKDVCKIHLRFGYDPKTEDYKVVKLTFLPRMVPQTGVYSMRKGSWNWKSISQSLPCHVTLIRHHDEVCVNEHVHWLCFTDLALKSQTMLAFKLSVEAFREIPLPDAISIHPGYRFNKFSVLGGKLCVMSCVNGGECEVWVMEEYGVAESWVKHHAFSRFSGDIVPFGFTSHGEFLFHKDHFAIYDPVADKVKTLKIMMENMNRIAKVVEYVDSLVWVTPPKREMSCHNISRLQI